MSSTDVILGAEPLERFRADLPLHSGLPAKAYCSDAFLELENRRLFPNHWVFVGFAHEMARAGDVAPVTVGEMPILLVRDKAGEINGFHNVCRHRCAKLVKAPGNVGKLVRCPYHAWAYGLDGRLQAAPHFGGPDISFPAGVSRGDYGLHRVRTAVWHDWVFVNINGNAPEFESYAAPLIARLGDLDLSAMQPIGSIDFDEVPTNWKFLMENFIEPYHVQFVHTTTTNQPLLDHSTVVDGPCLGSAVDISAPQARAGAKSLDVTSRYLTLFPNFVVGWYDPDELGVYLNIPVAPGVTRQRRVLYHRRAREMSDDDIADLKRLWIAVHQEDHEICERMQDGRRSPVAEDGGVLSPHWETSVRRFQELILAGCAHADQQ